MQLWRVFVAAVVIVAIASAASSRSRPVDREDPMSMIRRGCFDCHSQETRRPWYGSLPVASGLIERDVTAARGQLDFSHWTQYNPFDRADLLDKMCTLASTGRMPPWPYRVMHPDAKLSASDVAALCAWTADEAMRLVQGDR